MGNVLEGRQPSQVSKSCRQNGLDYEAKSNKSLYLATIIGSSNCRVSLADNLLLMKEVSCNFK